MKKFSNSIIKIYYLWLIISIIFPFIIVLYYSLIDKSTLQISFVNFDRILNNTYIHVLVKSILFSTIVTVICIIISYPIALIIYKLEKYKSLIILLITIPIFTNIMLRIYAWLVLFYKNGIIYNILSIYNIDVQYSNFEVYSGMVYNFLPFMIIPIFNSIDNIEKNLIRSAQDLGASSAQIIKKIIFPLSRGGLITGVNMTFFPSITLFVLPSILSAGKYNLIGNVIERQFTSSDNIYFGSSLIITLYIILLITLFIISLIKKCYIRYYFKDNINDK